MNVEDSALRIVLEDNGHLEVFVSKCFFRVKTPVLFPTKMLSSHRAHEKKKKKKVCFKKLMVIFKKSLATLPTFPKNIKNLAPQFYRRLPFWQSYYT